MLGITAAAVSRPLENLDRSIQVKFSVKWDNGTLGHISLLALQFRLPTVTAKIS
jgi:hypothetical protein